MPASRHRTTSPSTHRTRAASRSVLRVTWIAATLALLAGACSTGGSTIATASSDERPTSEAPASGELDWGDCEDSLANTTGLECSTLAVPIDHSDPGGSTLDLELARIESSGDPSQRIGSLLFNPGGPGGSGIEFLAAASVAVPDELQSRFDLVSWDPRGVGESSPVTCLDDEDKDAQLEGDISPDNQAETDRAIEDQVEFRAGCEERNEAVIEHMSTADVAADLDAIREALGDDQLNYVGFSYGTSIGATYATEYPDKVRAMVLDGSVSPVADDVALGVAQAQGFERTYLNFIAACDSDAQCALSGNTAAAVDQARQELDTEALLIDTESGPRELTRDLFDIGLATALYDTSVWGPLASAIADLEGGGGELLLSLADRQVGRNSDGTWDNSWDAQTMVNCADSAYRPTVEEALVDGDELAAASPTFGETFRTGSLSCVDWPLAASPVPEWTAAGAPPILVVGTVGDPATPYQWSEEMASALAGSVLLTYEGDGHTAFLRGGPCIDDAVVSYLIELTLPAEGTRCPVSAEAGAETFAGIRSQLLDEITAAGLPEDVAMCIVDTLEEELGSAGLSELLLGDDVDEITDMITRITLSCTAGGP